jgi:hypothetical protein
MLLRVTMIAAIVTLPFGLRPMEAATQEQGLDRAAEASAAASTARGQTKSHPGKRDRTLPPGIAKRFSAGETLPMGIERTRTRPAPDVVTAPDPEPAPDTGTGSSVCLGGILFVDGLPAGPC